MFIGSDIQERVCARIQECLNLAAQKFNREFPFPTVTYNLRGTTAGRAKYSGWLIQLNSELLVRNLDDFIKTTVPHEVAHLIDFEVYGRLNRRRHSAHGHTWKSVMWLFGVPANRCHNYDTSEVQRKIKRKYHYKCEACGADIMLGPVRHRKIVAGIASYSHRPCGSRGKFVLVKQLGQVTYKQGKQMVNDQPTLPAGTSKKDQTLVIYKTLSQIYSDDTLKKRFIQHCVGSLGMTEASATTYYYNCKRETS